MKKIVIFTFLFLISQKFCANSDIGEFPNLHTTENSFEKFPISKSHFLLELRKELPFQKRVTTSLLPKNKGSDFFSKPLQLSFRLSKNFKLIVSYN